MGSTRQGGAHPAGAALPVFLRRAAAVAWGMRHTAQGRGWAGLAAVAVGVSGGAALGAALGVASQPVLEDPSAWQTAESPVLRGWVQLTRPEVYLKAGEAYFSPDGAWVIFQAIPRPAAGEKAGEHYGMYVAPLLRDAAGEPTGLGEATRLSPEGSANTCGWFHPMWGRAGEGGSGARDEVMFGSTLVPPSEENVPGYQRGTGTYRWSFPSEMEIVTCRRDASGVWGEPRVMFSRPGYDAEGSWSPDGRHVLYANVDLLKSAVQKRGDADLYVFDTARGEHVPLVTANGYDGGPFFGPVEGASGRPRWVCYRSDRRGDNQLQLFAAELAYGDASDAGRITGIVREVPLTANAHVNWAPYWHPTGRVLVYATSEQGHFNYEVYAAAGLDASGEPRGAGAGGDGSGRDGSGGDRSVASARVTHALGFDGLPVFTRDGAWMMWTSQRGPMVAGEEKPSSQLWIARVETGALLRLVGVESGAEPGAE